MTPAGREDSLSFLLTKENATNWEKKQGLAGTPQCITPPPRPNTDTDIHEKDPGRLCRHKDKASVLSG